MVDFSVMAKDFAAFHAAELAEKFNMKPDAVAAIMAFGFDSGRRSIGSEGHRVAKRRSDVKHFHDVPVKRIS